MYGSAKICTSQEKDNFDKRMKAFVVFCLLMTFVVASQAQQKEATEMDEAELANMPELNMPEADDMVEDSVFEKAAAGEFTLPQLKAGKMFQNQFVKY